MVYTVILAGPRGVCSCEAGQHGRSCWHVARAQELAAARPHPALYSEAPEDAPRLPVLYCEAQDAYLLPDEDPIDLLWGAA